jgi:hexosaminidase
VLSGKVFPNSDIEVDYWAGQGLTPQAWTNMGVPLVNASENETYYVLDQGDTGRKPNPQYMYESWNPTLYQPYAGQSATAWQTQSDPTKNEGAVLHVWCDYPTAETEQQVAVGIMDPMRVLAQEDWGSPKLVPAYTDFAPIINAIGRPPLYGYEPAAISDMPPYLPYGIDPLANTTDQNADSWFAAAPSTPSNYVGVDLGRIESLSRVSIVAQSTATYYGSYPSVVEYSSDATTWTPLPTSGWPYLQAALPAGTQARYVRLRVTNPSATYPLNVYEFTADAAPM